MISSSALFDRYPHQDGRPDTNEHLLFLGLTLRMNVVSKYYKMFAKCIVGT